MNMFFPLWSKVVDSSLWMEEDWVIKVFLTMAAKKDYWDHICRGTAFNISRWANKSESEVLAAIKILSAPDTKRIEPQPFEGRRIEKVEGGWLILNGKFYTDMMRDANRNAYQAGKQREYRAEKKQLEEMSPDQRDEYLEAKAAEKRKRRKGTRAAKHAGIIAGAQEAIAEGFEEQRRELNGDQTPMGNGPFLGDGEP